MAREVKDKITKLSLSKDCSIDFKELLKTIKEWLTDNSYDIDEKRYEDYELDNELKNTNVRWDADKKIDDYNHLFLVLKIDLKNYKEIKEKGKRLVSGTVFFEVEAERLRDYRDAWEANMIYRFLRGFYDRFIAEEKMDKIAAQLKKDAERLYNVVKRYLGL